MLTLPVVKATVELAAIGFPATSWTLLTFTVYAVEAASGDASVRVTFAPEPEAADAALTVIVLLGLAVGYTE